jgi:hypothetical protein
MTPDHATEAAEAAAPLPLLMAADLQDHLMVASNDLERLQRLLADTCEMLMRHFHGAVGALGDLGDQAPPHTMSTVMQELGGAITALQFQDMASQLIAHTHQRLRNCADQLARDAFGSDEDGDAVVASAPLRPNPVTQDEMDAGSVELF